MSSLRREHVEVIRRLGAPYPQETLMSDLYHVEVSRVEDDEADLRVTVVHPDAGPVRPHATFALRLIWDPTDEYSYGQEFAVRHSPLAREMDVDDYLDEAFIDAQAQGFIAQVDLISEEDHPPPRWDDEDYEAFWDSDRRASATIRVKATHPGWLAHLREGMRWETAAYSSGQGTSWDERPRRRPGDYVERVSEDPMAQLRQITLDLAQRPMLKDAQVTSAVVPKLGAKHYSTRGQELRGESLSVEAARALLGQPVKYQEDRRAECGALVSVDDDGHLRIYQEYGEHGERGHSLRGASLSSLQYLGRAWHIERVPLEQIKP